MSFDLNEFCEVINPDFHDGSVLSIDVSIPGSSTIVLKTEADDRYLLVLSDVKHLRCSEFREGNIILDLSVFSRIVPPNSRLLALLGNEVADIHTEKYSESVLKGDLTFISIAPSYGCELQALCSVVELRPV